MLRIDLAPLGYQEFSPQVLASGAALVSAHYIDNEHVLLTFNKRRLMPRIPDDPPDDNDRNVDALLLELPSGRVLARTSWRMHDIGRYLWSLGHGEFLLRLRDRLVTIAPLANLKTGSPFQEHALIASSPDDRRGLSLAGREAADARDGRSRGGDEALAEPANARVRRCSSSRGG